MAGTATFIVAGLLVLAGTYSRHAEQLTAQAPAASVAAAPAFKAKKLTRTETVAGAIGAQDYEAEGGTLLKIARPAPRQSSN